MKCQVLYFGLLSRKFCDNFCDHQIENYENFDHTNLEQYSSNYMIINVAGIFEKPDAEAQAAAKSRRLNLLEVCA